MGRRGGGPAVGDDDGDDDVGEPLGEPLSFEPARARLVASDRRR